jgi:hypothetical protein
VVEVGVVGVEVGVVGAGVEPVEVKLVGVGAVTMEVGRMPTEDSPGRVDTVVELESPPSSAVCVEGGTNSGTPLSAVLRVLVPTTTPAMTAATTTTTTTTKVTSPHFVL